MAITTSAGNVAPPVARPHPAIGGWRVSFVLDPAGAEVCDLRGILTQGEDHLSEVWSYRWTP
jgi:glucans biosynthesis protein